MASILERDLDATIQDWTALVEHDEELNRIPPGFQDRSEHLPKLPNDLISRLLLPSLGKAPISIDAREHGTLRCEQGNTVAIVVGESRILQVSIVNTLQKNLRTVDFSQGAGRYEHRRRSGSQLKQAMLSYVEP